MHPHRHLLLAVIGTLLLAGAASAQTGLVDLARAARVNDDPSSGIESGLVS